MSEDRTLAAIMFTDIVGYTRLMGASEQKALALLVRNREVQKSWIERYNGRFVKELGDGTMATFRNASDAVRCAMAIQQAVKEDSALNLRIGIHLDEVVFENNDVFGDGVNVAARIESAGRPGAIFISDAVCSAVRNKDDIATRFVQQMQLKNVSRPIDVHEVALDGVFSEAPPKAFELKKASSRNRVLYGVTGIAIMLLAGWALSGKKVPATDGPPNVMDDLEYHDSSSATPNVTMAWDTTVKQNDGLVGGGERSSEQARAKKGFLTANGRLFIFTHDGKNGVRSSQGVVIPAVYDDITFVPELDVFGAESGSTMCAFDAFGKTIVPCDTYESIDGIQDERTERYWSLLYAHRVDNSGSQIGGCLYDLSGTLLNGCSTRMLFTGVNGTIESYEGRAAFQKAGKRGYINEQGEEIIPAEYEDLTQFHEGLAGAQKGSRWGFIDKFNQVKIPFEYEDVWIHPIGEGLFLAEVKLSGKYGLIDRRGRVLCPVKYESIGSFNGGLAPVNLNGKWGFINPVGKEIIPCQFGEASNFDKEGTPHWSNVHLMHRAMMTTIGL